MRGGLDTGECSDIAGEKVTGRNARGKARRTCTKNKRASCSPVREVSPAGELQPLGRNTAAHTSDQGEGCIRSEFSH